MTAQIHPFGLDVVHRRFVFCMHGREWWSAGFTFGHLRGFSLDGYAKRPVFIGLYLGSSNKLFGCAFSAIVVRYEQLPFARFIEHLATVHQYIHDESLIVWIAIWRFVSVRSEPSPTCQAALPGSGSRLRQKLIPAPPAGPGPAEALPANCV